MAPLIPNVAHDKQKADNAIFNAATTGLFYGGITAGMYVAALPLLGRIPAYRRLSSGVKTWLGMAPSLGVFAFTSERAMMKDLIEID